MMGFNIRECCKLNGNSISCVYAPSREIVLPERRAAAVLMHSAKELKWPCMNFTPLEEYLAGNGDKCLYDNTMWFLQEKQLGFMGGCHLPSGKEYVRTIHTVLFTLHPHLLTLRGRKANFVPPFSSPLLEKGVQQSFHSSPQSFSFKSRLVE